MAIDFPASPTNGQTYVVGSVTYTWDGTKWTAIAAGGGGSGDIIIEGNTSAEVIDTGSDGRFVVTTEGTEALRVDASRRLLVGTSTARSFNTGADSAQVQLEGTGFSSSNLSVVRSSADAGSPAVTIGKTRSSSVGGFTAVSNGDGVGNVYFEASDGTKMLRAAAISAVVDGTPGTNDMPGRLVFSTTADGASSPTERMRIESAGHVNIGKATYVSIDTNGHTFDSSGFAHHSVSSQAPLFLNRNVDDGNLVAFYQAGTIEGTISVSGTTVSYNGAHLSRWSQLSGIDPYDKTVRPEILRGTVMSNLDEMCDWTCPTSGDCQDNEQLNKTKISDVEGDKNVAGVFQGWDDDDDTWVNDFYLAMTGDFVIRIAAGTTVQCGDLLMSAGDGTAKPQDDDIIRSKTIAKVTSTNVSCTYDDGSYCVPCVLMAC